MPLITTVLAVKLSVDQETTHLDITPVLLLARLSACLDGLETIAIPVSTFLLYLGHHCDFSIALIVPSAK